MIIIRRTSSNSSKYYFFVSRLEEFKKVRWAWIFKLSNYNLRYAKSFLPFIRLFRVLDNDYIYFVWVYDPINDELHIILEEKFNILENPVNFKNFEDVYVSHELHTDLYKCLGKFYMLFDPIFINVKQGDEIRWGMSKLLHDYIKKSTNKKVSD